MPDKPNIVIFWGDDIGISNLSCYSDGLMGYRTPNIDRLASQGMRFTDSYGEQSCTAGRSAFITGHTDDDHGGSLAYLAEPDVFDDGPAKPVRIWSRIGRRPILAAGNSNGDIQMLRFTGGRERPALRLLVLHDDAEREFDYVKGSERALEQAQSDGWTVVSVKNDWATVFAA